MFISHKEDIEGVEVKDNEILIISHYNLINKLISPENNEKIKLKTTSIIETTLQLDQ